MWVWPIFLTSLSCLFCKSCLSGYQGSFTVAKLHKWCYIHPVPSSRQCPKSFKSSFQKKQQQPPSEGSDRSFCALLPNQKGTITKMGFVLNFQRPTAAALFADVIALVLNEKPSLPSCLRWISWAGSSITNFRGSHLNTEMSSACFVWLNQDNPDSVRKSLGEAAMLVLQWMDLVIPMAQDFSRCPCGTSVHTMGLLKLWLQKGACPQK